MLNRDWNTYSPNKQRWMLYRTILHLGQPATCEMIKAQLYEDYGANINKKCLLALLRWLKSCDAIRFTKQHGQTFWDIIDHTNAYDYYRPTKTKKPVPMQARPTN